jgi:hypothetical protein
MIALCSCCTVDQKKESELAHFDYTHLLEVTVGPQLYHHRHRQLVWLPFVHALRSCIVRALIVADLERQGAAPGRFRSARVLHGAMGPVYLPNQGGSRRVRTTARLVPIRLVHVRLSTVFSGFRLASQRGTRRCFSGPTVPLSTVTPWLFACLTTIICRPMTLWDKSKSRSSRRFSNKM